jgi:uncharacterized membrane protein YraQ (UPF0718 family)
VDEVKNFIIDFLSVFFEAMPFIVLGAIISGILEELVPQQFFARVVPKNRYLAIGMSALLGLVFPMCECGIVPVMRRLLNKGLPLGCCIAYMLCGPIINVVVLASTYFAFAPHWQKGGYQIIVLRAVLGYIVAVSTALFIDLVLYRKYGDSLLTLRARPRREHEKKDLSLAVVEETIAPAKKSAWSRLSAISETALQDFMDITIFLTIGSALAALSKQMIDMSAVGAFSTNYPAVAILAMMALAVVICLCSEADAFVAASFTELHPSAKLAFLVLGPMLDFKLMLLFTRVFRPRLIITIIICLVVLVFTVTMITHYLWDPLGFPSPQHPALARSS